jgi:DNA end-binding protein Ku
MWCSRRTSWRSSTRSVRGRSRSEFVDLDDIDPIYFVQPYYLGPTEGAERAYALLVKAMSDERKVAVARFVLRNKEHLAALRPMGDVLTLTTMRFADEIVAPTELDDVIPDSIESPKKKELDMAKQLVGSLTADFEPDKFEDSYREELLSLIQRKAEGEEVVAAVSEEPTPTKAPDLMAALEESLAAVKSEPLGEGAKGDGAKPKRSTAKKSTKSRSRSSSKNGAGAKKSSSKSRSRSKAKTAK